MSLPKSLSFRRTEEFVDLENNTINNFYKQNPEYKRKKQKLLLKFALTESQIREFLTISLEHNPKHYRAILVELFLGLRVSELAHLTIPQVNFTTNTIYILQRDANRYVESYSPKTPHSNRILPFEEKVKKALRSEIGNRKNGYVFLSNKSNNRGNRYNKRSIIRFINKYAKLCKSIGRTIGSHTLRRTYASYLINDPKRENSDKRITISDLKSLLGHKSIRTTLNYLFSIQEYTDFEKIRKALGRWIE